MTRLGRKRDRAAKAFRLAAFSLSSTCPETGSSPRSFPLSPLGQIRLTESVSSERDVASRILSKVTLPIDFSESEKSESDRKGIIYLKLAPTAHHLSVSLQSLLQ